MNKTLRGYVSSSRINNQVIPQRVQNILIRQYCLSIGVDYSLSATEYNHPNSSRVLRSSINECFESNINGLVFYSMSQLSLNHTPWDLLYKLIIEGDSELHFAIETSVVRTKEELDSIQRLLRLKKIVPHFHGADVYRAVK